MNTASIEMEMLKGEAKQEMNEKRIYTRKMPAYLS